MLNQKLKLKCSCGTYETSFDFDSEGTAVKATQMHMMLNGSHTVDCMRHAFNDGDSIPVIIWSLRKEK